METLILVARVGLSLAAVLGLLWWLGRRAQSSGALRRRREGLVVVGRQQLGGKAGVALIEADGRRIVVGYGEHGVTLLHDGGLPGESAEHAPVANLVMTAPATMTGSPLAATSERELDSMSATAPSGAAASVRPDAPVHIRSTSARTADALRPRTPLEGSILAPDTWRKAVVAAQEWTTRRS